MVRLQGELEHSAAEGASAESAEPNNNNNNRDHCRPRSSSADRRGAVDVRGAGLEDLSGRLSPGISLSDPMARLPRQHPPLVSVSVSVPVPVAI